MWWTRWTCVIHSDGPDGHVSYTLMDPMDMCHTRHLLSVTSHIVTTLCTMYNHTCILVHYIIMPLSTYFSINILSILCMLVSCWIPLLYFAYLECYFKRAVSLNSHTNNPFVCTYTHSPKIQVTYGHSAHLITALLSETFLQWFRVAWEIHLDSSSPRHTSVILWYNIMYISLH